ncbi:hypothetical protein [Achromobacter deleyi]|uniref:hypothetical protein n=1 Tax=Achromobacter deleyi TaxID=1353891 RepID=UPI00146808B7|nr:hypothetical protein [Achromobacter deleyi]CAB3922168.1 hypothetical protein LMG3412_05406 [Achromobacter deleyi]
MQANPNLSTTPPLPGVVAVPALNEALQTIATDFSGDTDPAALAWPFSKWVDTANNLIKRRNAAGTAWVIEGALFRPVLNGYDYASLPSIDVGDVFVPGYGIHRFKYGRYAPDGLPPRHRVGGMLSPTASSVTVAAGSWRGAANDVDILLGAPLSKNLQASGAWASGSGSNGIVGGTAATSTWYHVHVIRQDSSGAVDICLDTSPIAANRPAGWSAYRRIGAVFNQASGGILPFFQEGSRVRFLLPQFNINNTSLLNPVLITVTVPPGVKCLAQVNMVVGTQTATSIAYVYSPDETDRNSAGFGSAFGGNGFLSGGQMDVMTNTASQLFCRASAMIPSGVFLTTVAYYDFIGD